MILLLLACAGPDPAADRVAFRDLDCARIVDDGLRDECVIFAVREDPDAARRLCPGVKAPALADECWFIAVDAAELTGEAALRGCMAAGRFDDACRANAVSREVSRLAPMPEAALTEEVRRILATYRRPAKETRDIVRRRLAAVGEGAAASGGAVPTPAGGIAATPGATAAD